MDPTPDPVPPRSPSLRRPWSAHAAAYALGFAATGLVEWLLGLGSREGGGALGLLGLSVGLWALLGWLVATAVFFLGRSAFGAAADAPALPRLRRLGRRWWAERGSEPDGRRTAALLGGLVSLPLFAAGSVAWTASLIEHRHGAVLIALTAVGGQVALLVAAGLTGAMVRRVALGLGRRLSAWPSFPTLLALATLATVGAAGAAIARFHETLRAVDAGSLALVGVALALAGLAHAWLARRPPRGAWAVPIAALALVYVAAQPPPARQALQARGLLARYLYGAVTGLSDLDGDGAPAFPVALDCAPFNPAVSPYAAEIPHNGVDENCDGLDDVPTLWAPDRNAYTPRPGPPPNLVLVTFDALRADHTGFDGYERPTTPHMDRVAERAVVFTRTYSQDSGTGPSLSALMTGKTPFQIKLPHPERFPPTIALSEQTLAEELKKRGYQTAAVLCGSLFGKPHWNLRQGFDRFGNVCGKRTAMVADLVTDRALEALQQLDGRDKPFFLWVHYLDTHQPYHDHPDVAFGSRPVDDYDEELAYADRSFQRLWEALSPRMDGPERATYLAIGADHGENFGEHGTAPHARTLYREVTHIPHFVTGPGVVPRRVDAPVALGDLYVTFLQLAGAPIPQGTTMTGHMDVLFGAAPDPLEHVFQENSYSRPKHHVKGLVRGRYHYLRDLTSGVEELYDVLDDPREQHNLMGAGVSDEPLLRQLMQRFLETTTLYRNLSM